MGNLKSQVVVQVENYGQIGAGRVVDFIPRNSRFIPLPVNAKASDCFCEFEVCGDSLTDLGIQDGMMLTCKRIRHLSEIKPTTVCVVLIHSTNERTAKMVKWNANGTVSLIAANPRYKPQHYPVTDVEILAIAVEARKAL